MPLTAREFDRVVRKFGFEVRGGDHVKARLYVGGRVVVRSKRSRKDSGDLPHHQRIRQQLRLTEQQLRDAVNCPLDRDGYMEILRGRGIIK